MLDVVQLAHRRGVKVKLAPSTTELLVHEGEYVPGQEACRSFELRPPILGGVAWAVEAHLRPRRRVARARRRACRSGCWSRSPIKLDSRGPVLFVDRRIGVGEREFGMLKFRTMVADAAELQPALEESNEASGALFKIRDDPRVTRVGGVLRRLSIDELPQLVNVLRGEMSLVGPRPAAAARPRAARGLAPRPLPRAAGHDRPLADLRPLRPRLRRPRAPRLHVHRELVDAGPTSRSSRRRSRPCSSGAARTEPPGLAAPPSATTRRPRRRDRVTRAGRTAALRPGAVGRAPYTDASCARPGSSPSPRRSTSTSATGAPPPGGSSGRGCTRRASTSSSRRIAAVPSSRRGGGSRRTRRTARARPTPRSADGLARAQGRPVPPARRGEPRGERARPAHARDDLEGRHPALAPAPRAPRRGGAAGRGDRVHGPDGALPRDRDASCGSASAIPVAFYDGDVPMSLPEFGGMDTGFNYYHGADPSEYDLVLSNSEGGARRLLELGARRVEPVLWAADPEFFRPAPGREGARRLLLRLRRQVPPRVDGGAGRRAEPARSADRLRARRPRLPGRRRWRAAARATSRSTSFARAISAARVNLNVTRRSHATVPRLVDLPAVRARGGGRGDRLQPARRDRALVRAGQRADRRRGRDGALAAYHRLLDDPAEAVAMGARARERVLDEHTYAHRARQVLRALELEAAVPA